jgi:hypothetical protein
MSSIFRLTLALCVLVSLGAKAQETGSTRDGQREDAEVCEAFSWDVPVEQSFSVESVLRWRRLTRGAGQQQHPRSPGLFSARTPLTRTVDVPLLKRGHPVGGHGNQHLAIR